ncbi:hypothetical protein CTEN210_12717 [Chaetoceros tenuissimus]|uniref:SGNH hydrolase-type esterase domain-containing protein n=1 Tax=Chaetoceros tenuissimus TaxID=426638 RepID=A0AAD3D3T5_9STRA|nr:hypothetical protein CTEN210_12717 [Chaetoceros tenuissimus]
MHIFQYIILALFACILYSDVSIRQKQRDVQESSSLSAALRGGNLAQDEYNITLMHELHLPFGEKGEKIIPKRKRKTKRDIKYTAFGSSHTWGAALKNRDEETYIKQLAKPYFENGVNNGIRSAGPSYPANCLYSIIGEEIFDVIVLEFYMHAEEGLKQLAIRIRERFTDAIIVIVHHWMPLQIVNDGILDDRSWPMHLMQYAEKNGFGRDYMHNPEFHELLKTTPDQWDFNHDMYKNIENLIRETAEAINGYTFKTPLMDRQRDGQGGWVHFGDQLLSTDSFHPSPQGHIFIANQIRDIVERVGIPKNPRVQPFAQKDQCYNWRMDGILDSPNVSFGDSFKMVNMPNTEKYALELQNNDENGNNWINLFNEGDDFMDVYIGHMTTSPEQKYPMVEAFHEQSDNEKFELSPTPTDLFGGKDIHVERMTYLGIITPKSSLKIYFKPMGESEWPFRIMSIMINPRFESENK